MEVAFRPKNLDLIELDVSVLSVKKAPLPSSTKASTIGSQ